MLKKPLITGLSRSLRLEMGTLQAQYGKHVDWVNRELPLATVAKKELLFLSDPGVLKNVPEERIIYIARSDLQGTITAAMKKVQETRLAGKAKDALTWLVLGGLLFILFRETTK